MIWKIKIHHLVFKEDFKVIPPFDQNKIIKAIKKKLSLSPESYGKALSGDLAGLWRLRVEDYRVIYRINKEEIQVLVIKIGIRRDYMVYDQLLSRLKKL